MRKKRALILIDLVLVLVLAASLIALVVTLVGYAVNRARYAAVSAAAVSTSVPAPALTPAPEPAEETPWQLTLSTPSPEPLETPPVSVDFETVRQDGQHVRAWLYSADTIVNYPVVYYSNNEYYLTHDYTGARSNAGALFFDTRVGKQLASENLIIYGHHMKDRSMFGSLLQYQKQDYYDAHRTLYLLTLEGNYRIDLFAARFTDSESKYFPCYFASPEEKRAFVMTAMANSDFTPRDDAYRPDARLVTLATCAYSNYVEDAKYQVLGYLTRID